jgi:hypothetical protein
MVEPKRGDDGYLITMSKYRFITPHRAGKWYSDLETAKRFACKFGAGFFDSHTKQFVAYVHTKLEVSSLAGSEPQRVA